MSEPAPSRRIYEKKTRVSLSFCFSQEQKRIISQFRALFCSWPNETQVDLQNVSLNSKIGEW